MAKLEILIRFQKEKTKAELAEERENIKIKKLTMGDDYDPQEEYKEDEWSYGKGIIDTKDIEMINDLDPQHITVRLYSGKAFVLKAPYEYFLETYQNFGGYSIISAVQENIEVNGN